MGNTKHIEPPVAALVVFLVGNGIESDTVHQPTGYNTDGRQIALI